jgi:hypothetical protein
MSTGSINDDSRPSSGPPVNTAPTAHHPAQGTSMRVKDGAVGTSPYAGSSSNRGMTIDDPMRLQEQQRPVGPCGSSRGDPESQVEQNRPTASQSNKAHAASSGSRSDPEWKQRVRHKQQRLLLLHHAAKCPHENRRVSGDAALRRYEAAVEAHRGLQGQQLPRPALLLVSRGPQPLPEVQGSVVPGLPTGPEFCAEGEGVRG